MTGIDSQIDRYLKSNVTSKSIAYIRGKTDETRKYFGQVEKYYASIVLDVDYYDLDKNYSKQAENEILSYAAIHLGGGITADFLEKMKKNQLIDKLRHFAENRGVLIGESAGSIIMTKDISIAGFLDEELDSNNNINGLNLVEFDFYPHYEADMMGLGTLKELKNYSAKRKRDLYGCCDGSGIIIHGTELRTIGIVYKL